MTQQESSTSNFNTNSANGRIAEKTYSVPKLSGSLGLAIPETLFGSSRSQFR